MQAQRIKNRALVVIPLVGALAMALFSGCTPSQPTSNNSSQGGVAGSALQQILQRGSIRVADCLTFPPFGFTDANGKPQGYDVDIAQKMADELKVKLEVVDTTSANRIPNLQTGKVDVVICNFTRNGDRQTQIDFTDPYVVATESLLVKGNANISTAQDLTGKTVAVVKGSTNGDEVIAVNPKAKIQQFDSSAAAILAVQQGQADAMVEDSNFLNYQASLDPSLKVTNDQLIPLEYNGFGVKQGDQVWLNWLNGFLFRLNASGTNAQLYQKWFGTKPRYPLHPAF